MSTPTLNPSNSFFSSVTNTAQKLATTLGSTSTTQNQELWVLTSDVPAYVAQGIADTVFTASATTDLATVAAGHKLYTGAVVQVSNSGGGLPAGLSATTNYWVSVASPTTFSFYDTYAHAVAGGATGLVDITTNGTGTQTATTVATAGAGSQQIGAGQQVLVDAAVGAQVSIIRDGSTSGSATLARALLAR